MELFEPFAVSLNAVIRPCRREDLPTLEWFGMFAPHRKLIQSTFERHERGQAMMLTLEVNGVASGQVWIEFERQEIDSTGVLWAVRVIPCLQNLGIGSRLISAGEEILVSKGFEYVELTVEKDATSARRFYERLGYRLVGSVQPGSPCVGPHSTAASGSPDQYVFRKAILLHEARQATPTSNIHSQDESP